MAESVSFTRRVIGGLAWSSSGAVARGLVQVAVLGVMARLLTPDDFGLISAALVIVSFGTIFTQLGVGQALVQRVELSQAHVRVALTLSLLFGVSATLFAFTSASLVAGFFRMPALTSVLQALSIIFIIKGAGTVAESLLLRSLKFKLLAMIDGVSYIVGYGFIGVVFAWLEYGPWALVAANIGQSVVATLTTMIAHKHSWRPLLTRRLATELLAFGGGVTVGQIANQCAAQADNVVVGRWLGAEALGIYSRAYQLLVMPAALFGQVLGKVMFPALAKHQKDYGKLERVYKKACALIALAILPLSAFAIVFASEIIDILLGRAWKGVVTPFQILILGLFFRTGYKLSEPLIKATGNVTVLASRQIGFAFVTLAFTFLGSLGGVTGVALGVSLAAAVHFFRMTSACVRIVKSSWRSFLIVHLPGALLGIFCFVIALALKHAMEWGGLSDSLLRLAIAPLGIVLIVAPFCALVPHLLLGPDGMWLYKKARKINR